MMDSVNKAVESRSELGLAKEAREVAEDRLSELSDRTGIDFRLAQAASRGAGDACRQAKIQLEEDLDRVAEALVNLWEPHLSGLDDTSLEAVRLAQTASQEHEPVWQKHFEATKAREAADQVLERAWEDMRAAEAVLIQAQSDAQQARDNRDQTHSAEFAARQSRNQLLDQLLTALVDGGHLDDSALPSR